MKKGVLYTRFYSCSSEVLHVCFQDSSCLKEEEHFSYLRGFLIDMRLSEVNRPNALIHSLRCVFCTHVPQESRETKRRCSCLAVIAMLEQIVVQLIT